MNQAIDTCTKGSALAPYGLNNSALLIVLKTLRGDITQQDWDRFQQRLETVPMTFDNRRAPQILTSNALQGVKLDKLRLLQAIDTLIERAPLQPVEVASMGYFVMNDLESPDRAIPHFAKAINAANPLDPFPQQLEAELRAKGRPDLADKIKQISLARYVAASTLSQIYNPP